MKLTSELEGFDGGEIMTQNQGDLGYHYTQLPLLVQIVAIPLRWTV